MIIDTHCHYNMIEDWQTAWQRAQNHGVVGAVIAGVVETENVQGLAIAAQVPQLKAAIGFHPENFVVEQPLSEVALADRLQADTTRIQALADQLNPSVVAIGEVGLDYFRLPEDPVAQRQTRQLQQHAFIAQVLVAQEHRLPLLIHVRDQAVPETLQTENAYWDTVRILREYHHGYQPFILHCVSGPLAYLSAALELGAYVGVAGNVTYKNADAIRALVKMTPTDRILLETDAPFLPPVPHRGQPCEPWMISLTATYLQDELGFSLDTLYQNTLRFFPSFA